jgi:hypothetical protein
MNISVPYLVKFWQSFPPLMLTRWLYLGASATGQSPPGECHRWGSLVRYVLSSNFDNTGFHSRLYEVKSVTVLYEEPFNAVFPEILKK